VIWTHIPSLEEIRCLTGKRTRTAIVPLWHECESADWPALAAVHAVFAPALSVSRWLSQRGRLTNVHTVPWDIGLPVFHQRRLVDRDALHLLVPAYDGRCRQLTGTLLDVLGRLLLRHSHVRVTLLANSSTIAPYVSRRAAVWTRYFGDRFQLRRGVAYADRPLYFLSADLVVWPAVADNFGTVPLLAAACGTPVLVNDVAPVSECVTGGLVVPAIAGRTATGVARVETDYACVSDALDVVASNPSLVNDWRLGASARGHSRRDVFDKRIGQWLLGE
jgi:hypothetical protein